MRSLLRQEICRNYDHFVTRSILHSRFSIGTSVLLYIFKLHRPLRPLAPNFSRVRRVRAPACENLQQEIRCQSVTLWVHDSGEACKAILRLMHCQECPEFFCLSAGSGTAKLRTRCRPVLTSQTLGTRLMNSELSVSKATHCQASCLPYDDARKATAPQSP